VTTPTPGALRDLALDVATEAAVRVAARAGARDLRVETKSTLTDPVTEVDREVEAMVVAALLDARPDDGVAGEEGASRPSRSGVRWLIDPIEGYAYVYRPGATVRRRARPARISGNSVLPGFVLDLSEIW